MAFLYLDPMLYAPYDLSLRKKNAIVIKEFSLIHGNSLPTTGFKTRRMPNRNYIYLEFTNPNYVDVSEIVGSDVFLSVFVHYELHHSDRVINVKHLQHLAFVTDHSQFLEHFNLKHACPAMYGLKGKRILESGGLPSGRSKHRKILQYGLDGENHEGRKWSLETFDLMTPFEQLRHGTIH